MTSVLRLTVKKKWFDMIASGQKKEEYRDIKVYWIRRLEIHFFDPMNKIVYGSAPKKFDYVLFKNGYGSNVPELLIQCKGIKIGIGRRTWGATGNRCYIIKLGKIINHKL